MLWRMKAVRRLLVAHTGRCSYCYATDGHHVHCPNF